VLERARAASITAMVSIGSGKDLASARSATALAERYPFIWATVGVHPHDVKAMSPADWEALDELSTHPRVVGIGETGLDYYYDHSPRPAQREAFERFCVLSKKRDLPVVVHVRDAHPIASTFFAPPAFQAASFTASPEGPKKRAPISTSDSPELLRYRDLQDGKPDSGGRALCPRERLLVETDAPFLARFPCAVAETSLLLSSIPLKFWRKPGRAGRRGRRRSAHNAKACSALTA